MVNVVAFGNSPKEVVYHLEELIKEVDADEAEKETSSLHKILSDFRDLKEIGINF